MSKIDKNKLIGFLGHLVNDVKIAKGMTVSSIGDGDPDNYYGIKIMQMDSQIKSIEYIIGCILKGEFDEED